MESLPPAARLLLLSLPPCFTRPTFRRAIVLLFAAILTTGRRTTHNLLRTAGILSPCDSSSYCRVLSEASWSRLRLATASTRFVVVHLGTSAPLMLVEDDTVDVHRRKKRFTAKRAIATPSTPAIRTPPIAMATSGSSSPCPSVWPARHGRGLCRCWSCCTRPKKTTLLRADATVHRLPWSGYSCVCCCAGCPSGPWSSWATRATTATSRPTSRNSTAHIWL